MSRKWDIKPLSDDDLKALEEFCPKAVVTTRKMNYGIVSKLLECGLEVPGIKINEPKPKPSGVANQKDLLGGK